MSDVTPRLSSANQSSLDNTEHVLSSADRQNYNGIPDSWGLIDEPVRDLSSDEDVIYLFPRGNTMAAQTSGPPVPELFTTLPPIRDFLNTDSSRQQDCTIQECLPYLSGTENPKRSPFEFNAHGLPRLEREKHIAYLRGSLGQLPAGYVVADASRPWMLYWALTGLYLLGEDVSQYRNQVILTLTPMQNADGGFGGGHGQMSHCASSYAAILCLIMAGGDEALNMIDRKML
ncbi:MAG: CAAX farnesyltransferase (FTase) subunit beta [Pleopsidium flavum]|nr:MAG: CAAX farnesyltransferase (FTase) subunit beta [Pleopsidium flavum]